jgi:glyoxylase-like metal-dependent hydrolase (beta-lactamase superfamily II)
MRNALRLLLPAATATLLSCATGSKSQGAAGDLVDRALKAQGGADAVSHIRTLSVKAQATYWEPEQSVKPDGEPRLAADATITSLRDLDTKTARIEYVKKFVYPAPREYRYTEIVTPTAGQVQGIDTTSRTKESMESNPPHHTMSTLRVLATQRELLRASPALLLDMQRNPSAVTPVPDQQAGGASFPCVKYQAGDVSFLVLFDRASGLPARIRTLDTDNIWGDSTYDLVLDDWRDVSGVKIAHAHRYLLNGRDIIRVRYDGVQVNPPIVGDALLLPADVRPASVKPAPGAVPYQWVIRRQHIGTYLDSDTLGYDAGAMPDGPKLVQIAPGVEQTQGTTHNSLVVEMADHLIVFDAPVGETQARWTLDQARARHPGKPVRYLVLSHHHMDHTGGAKLFVAGGATVVVGAGAGDHFRRAFAAPDKIANGALERNPRRAEVVEVADRMKLTDGKRTVEVIRIQNPHVDPMLMGWIPDAKLGFVVDIWSPGRDKVGDSLNPGQAALVAAVKKAGIAPERFAGGHGTVAEYPALERVASGR